jgi:hypothetical protein
MQTTTRSHQQTNYQVEIGKNSHKQPQFEAKLAVSDVYQLKTTQTMADLR